jgi:hypothetical protein
MKNSSLQKMSSQFCKYIFLVLFILSVKKFHAQNLSQNFIPNGSFEKMRSFSIDSFGLLSQQDTNWIEYFGPNYFFSKLFSPIPNAPKNYIGYQEPQNGNNYYYLVSIFNISKYPSPYYNEEQTYAQIKLKRKLRKKKVKGSFYVSLGDTNEFASSRIGITFSISQLIPQYFCPFNSCPFISAMPQIQRPFGQAVIDKMNWTKIEGIFTGNGEEWLTLGNFYRANQTDTIRVSNIPDSISGAFTEGAGYYIDNLSLVEEDRAEAYFDTTKKYLCVQQGMSKVLGDTAVRPWLFYTWRNANGDSIANTRNYTYNAALLENTFFTLEIKDTGEYAFITKAIDTVFVSTSISGLGCTYVGIEDVMKDAGEVDFYYADNKIVFNQLHERFVDSELLLKSIDGKIIFNTKLERKQYNYIIDKPLANGLYFIEINYEDRNVKRKKIVANRG